jgi:D-tyrosyl-tRNA(Tyr) deacylase
MKMLIQRVLRASVSVDGKVEGQIDRGFLILMGICAEDTKAEVDRLVEKTAKLRIFEDEAGKTNLSIEQVGGRVLLISQFTLYADTSHGNRPSFIGAARPETAKPLYEYAVSRFKERLGSCESGIFGADMKVDLCNDGPFTVMLE